jgi:hypothetical protein
MAVEVVTRRDLPVEQHAVAAVCEGGEHEGLVDGQELVFVGGRAEQSLPSCDARSGDAEEGEERPEYLHGGQEVSGLAGDCRDSLPAFIRARLVATGDTAVSDYKSISYEFLSLDARECLKLGQRSLSLAPVPSEC